MLPTEVFLSHSNLDQSFATAVVEMMRRQGIPVWYSQTNIIGAQQWHDEIGAALKRCDWFVLILSPSSVNSVWVKREVLFALNDNRYAEKIIPLLYQPCDSDQLSWTRSLLQVIDFRQDFENGYRELLRVRGPGYKR
jgi:hypothetical protein